MPPGQLKQNAARQCPLNFQLTKEEWQQVFTICDKRSETAKFSLCMPFAFSEQGVAMLSSI